ncbi:MAG: diacylglycerol kinase family lipid kinase [Longimicrobiales bacterium]|nr:diacylglycerol kinase family lipid kinase [Longimicrobiales bacterium]
MVPRRRADLRGAGAHLSSVRDRRAFIIANPASGRGRGARRLAAYRELLAAHLPGAPVATTRHPGHERALADEALAAGCDLLVAIGGDGTWSHVADRIVASGRGEVALGILPSGTGNDFGRNLRLRYRDPADAVRRLVDGVPRPVDVGRVVTASRPAEPGKLESDGARPRHFLNVIGVGFDVAVVVAAADARFLRGEVLYKVTALQQLFRFHGTRVRVVDESAWSTEGRHLMITLTNGAYFGGGFPIAPGARVDDGLLHACLIGDARPLRRMALFSRAGRGRHEGEPEVVTRTARGFTLTLEGPVHFEADGDLYRTDGPELAVELLPGALQMIRDREG